VNYELGAKNQFTARTAVNLTFFVKDTYDYPVATLFPRLKGSSNSPVQIFLNGHFARSRGFEVEWERRRTNYWSGKLTYSYQQTKGKSSDPNEKNVVTDASGNAAETRLSETFVRWNRPHKLSANFDIRFDKEAPNPWLRHAGLNVYVQGISGRAYTPQDILGNPTAETYSGNAPFQFTTDLKISRSVGLGSRRMELSVAGTNVFNNFLIYRVDPVTGRGRVWGVGDFDTRFEKNNLYRKQSQADDPSNYGPGAEWRLTLDYDF
jgi:hypothetical protein